MRKIAVKILIKFKFDNAGKSEENNSEKNKTGNKSQSKNESKEEDEVVELSFAQFPENTCFCCGKKNHTSKVCRQKDMILRDDWYINKLKWEDARQVQNAHSAPAPVPSQVTTTTASGSFTTSTTNNTTGSRTGVLNGFHVDRRPADSQFPQDVSFLSTEDLRNVIILDNESSTSIFCNPEFVSNVRQGPYTLGVDTNGGYFLTDKVATVPGIGTTWFIPKTITNIIAFNDMQKLFRITCDTKEENAFIVHTPEPMKFTVVANGLYVFRPSVNYRKMVKELQDSTTTRNTAVDTTVKPKKSVSFASSVKKLEYDPTKEASVSVTGNCTNTVEENKTFTRIDKSKPPPERGTPIMQVAHPALRTLRKLFE